MGGGGGHGVEWINLTQDRDHRRALVNTTIIILVP
jgi:hypothetical protein